MTPSEWDRLLVPVIVIVGAEWIAGWCFHRHELRKEMRFAPPNPRGFPPPSISDPPRGPEWALAWLAGGVGTFWLFRRLAPGWARLGYVPLLIGLVMMAAYLARRARWEEERKTAGGEGTGAGKAATSFPRGGRGAPLP